MEADIKKITSTEELLEICGDAGELCEEMIVLFESPVGKVIKMLLDGKINQAGTAVLDGGLKGSTSDGIKCAFETYKQIGVVDGLKDFYNSLVDIMEYNNKQAEELEVDRDDY